MSLPERPEQDAGSPLVTAADALAGLPVAPGARLEAARLSPIVATTLRAALDLVLGSGPPLRDLGVTSDDTVLEIRCSVSRPDALVVAGGLLESIEGCMTRASEGRGEWIVRVPLATTRPTFLMLTQARLGLAIPWHAVLRVRMMAPGQVPAAAGREGAGLIPPFASAADTAVERPVVVLGSGLKRAIMVADRLIWRLPADPVASVGTGAAPSLTKAVQTSDGEVFWVVNPAELMRDLEIVPLPSEKPAAKPLAAPPAPAPTVPIPVRPVRPQIVVDPGRSVVTPPPAPMPVPEARAPQAPDPTVALRAPVLRVLLAEDSIVGRVFLTRLLERRGFAVETVARARGLEEVVAKGAWDLVMADVELPDSLRADHLRRLVAVAKCPLVALVRDREDEALARAAGIRHSLRKPFEAEALDLLLPTLDLPGQDS